MATLSMVYGTIPRWLRFFVLYAARTVKKNVLMLIPSVVKREALYDKSVSFNRSNLSVMVCF